MATIINNQGIWTISLMVLNEETNKKVRKRISTGLKATAANKKIAEEKFLKQINKELMLR